MNTELQNPDTSKRDQHLGHLFLEGMKERPNVICQIDVATGKEETNVSVLNRSIRLARCFRDVGVQPGDVLCLSGRNHLDLYIPYYAALLNGLPINGVDPLYKHDEIKKVFQLARPKLAFCEEDSYDVYVDVITELGLETRVITFGNGANSMEKFVEKHGTNESIEDFKPAEFDVDKVHVLLVSTSGTTGHIKLAAVKHNVYISKIRKFMAMANKKNKEKNAINMNVSPVNWISGLFNAVGSPLMHHTNVQTSNPEDFDQIINIINNYKPVLTLMSPMLMSSLLRRKQDLDLTCFRVVFVTGSKIYQDVVTQFRALLHKDAVVMESYGMTETLGPCLAPNPLGPPGTCGRPMPPYQLKLVDPDTGLEITEPNTPGELWVKGENFSGFYNDSEETARTHSADGFYKSGDLLYRDENDNFFFVDRLKSLIKHRNYHILPAELEEVIHTHPAVREVCVCGIPDQDVGEIPVACVVPRDGCYVTAQEIKELVASKLSKTKHLSGVVFLDKLPMTSTDKIIRTKLINIISHLPIE